MKIDIVRTKGSSFFGCGVFLWGFWVSLNIIPKVFGLYITITFKDEWDIYILLRDLYKALKNKHSYSYCRFLLDCYFKKKES